MSLKILAYMAENPRAQDTLEGIVEWWLLEQKIKEQTAIVRQSLNELVSQGLVIERRGKDLRSHYRINDHKMDVIQLMLKQDQAEEKQ